MNLKGVLIGMLLLFSVNTYACMPFSVAEIIVGTYEGKEERIHPDVQLREGRSVEFIRISGETKPFGENYKKIGKYYFLHSDQGDVRFNLRNYKKGDLVIMVSDYNNGDFEDYFAVYEIGRLVRRAEGGIDIVDMQGSKKDWGKTMWQCGNYKPDGALDKEKLLNDLSMLLSSRVLVHKGSNNYSLYVLGTVFVSSFGFFLVLKSRRNKKMAK